MLDKDIKQHINTARQILVGKVPDPKAQVEQITNALIYKFMDDMDRENEELEGKAQFLSGELKEFAWGRLMSRELSGMERWNLYTRALEAFSRSEQIPELFRRIFKGAYLPYRDAETLNLFLKEINAFSYDNSENLGNAYEYLLSVLGSQGDAGQFRTPRHIIDFIVETVDPQKTDRILDPACGTAGFLISSYKHIWRTNSSNFDPEHYTPGFAETGSPDSFTVEIQRNGKYDGMKLTPDDRKRIARNMEGYDISPDMVRLSLVNLYLHNFPEPKIVEYDTLTYEDRWDHTFHVILANPPFMSPKGGIRPHRRFRVSANRAEVLFVDYIAEHLTVNGRAGVIVPEGIIFQSATAYKALRKMLVEDRYLYAVVSLPAGVFQPYSGVKTSILFMDRALAKQKDEILFIKVENDGFDLGAQRRRIDKNDLGEACRLLKDWQAGRPTDSPLALTVPKSRIAETETYDLKESSYREIVDYSHMKWPMVELGNEKYFKIESGGTPSSSVADYWNGKINWVTLIDLPANNLISNIWNTERKISELGLNKSSAKLLPEKSILVSSRATIGRIGINHIPLATNQGFKNIVIKDFSKVNEKFVAYMIITLIPQMDRLASGGTYKEISKTVFSNFKIPLPPLEVQKSIVEELDGYQRIIDGARQVVEAWRPRIDVDPDWPRVKLGEVCEIKSGGTPSTTDKTYYSNGKIPWLKSEVCKDRIINEAHTFITEEGLRNSSAKILKINTTLIALVGATIGKTGFITFEAATNQNVAGLYPLDDTKLNSKYLFYTCQNLYSHFLTLGSGKFRMANLSFIKSLEIPVPPINRQNKIVSQIEFEQCIIDKNIQLIGFYQQRIQDKISEIWGD